MKATPICVLHDISRAILAFEDGFKQRYGFSLNEGMLLCVLSQEKRRSCHELVEELGMSASNTSKVLKAAEAKGFIRRILGASDRRCMFFYLSDEGAEQLAVIEKEASGINELLSKIKLIIQKANEKSAPVNS